jgi:AcrR family transcriptional regulator
MPTALSAKERIMASATELFYERGFRAVGIDTIIEHSGVAKMSLYRNFPTKDDLIIAYLNATNDLFWERANTTLAATKLSPIKRLETFFEGTQAFTTSSNCAGCTFMMASSDFPELDHPVHQVATQHKQRVIDQFERLAREAKLTKPKTVAQQLLLLLDGSLGAARMFGPRPTNPAQTVSSAARAIIQSATPKAKPLLQSRV